MKEVLSHCSHAWQKSFHHKGARIGRVECAENATEISVDPVLSFCAMLPHELDDLSLEFTVTRVKVSAARRKEKNLKR